MESENNGVLERLVIYLKYRKIPFARMERKAGFSNGYLRNNKGGISGEKLSEVIKTLPELNGDWLLTGRGDMEIKNDTAPAVSISQTSQNGGKFAGRDFNESVQMNAQENEMGILAKDPVIILYEDGKEVQVDITGLHKKYLKAKSEIEKLKNEYIELLKENKELIGDNKKKRSRR